MYSTQGEKSRAFAKYLSLPEWDWDWFVTLTYDPYKCGFIKRKAEFELGLHSDIVMESWKFFMREVGETANAAWGWMFAEKQVNGRPHWHALVHVGLNLLGQPLTQDVWRRMFDKYGRCDIQLYEPNHVGSVCNYLTKYVAKEQDLGESTFDFAGFLSGSEADSSQILRCCGVDGAGIGEDSKEKETVWVSSTARSVSLSVLYQSLEVSQAGPLVPLVPPGLPEQRGLSLLRGGQAAS